MISFLIFFQLFGVTICNFTGNQCRKPIKLFVAETTDEILMENVKSGNLSDMSVLFERYHLRVYNFFFRLTFDMDVSNDLTQNLFYRMIKYRHTFNNRFTFKSWIYQMARNIHTDYYLEKRKKDDLFVSTEQKKCKKFSFRCNHL